MSKRLTLLDTINLRTTAVYRNPRGISPLNIVYGDLSNSRIPCTPIDKEGMIWHASDRPMQSITKVFAGDQEKTSGFSAFTAYQDETGQSIACVVFNSPQFDKPISVAGKGTIKLDTSTSSAGELIENPADLIKDICLNVQGYDADSIDLAEIAHLYADCLKEEIKVAFILSDAITIKQLFDEQAQNIHAHWMISDGKSVMRLRWL